MNYWQRNQAMKYGSLLISIFILALLSKWLWNALMPDIFGLPIISYLQALGLMFLIPFIFYVFILRLDMPRISRK